MSDGILINQGTVSAIVSGFSGTVLAGQTFVPITGAISFAPGQTVPLSVETTIPPTDAGMARVTEDLFVALITKGVLVHADLPAASLAKINARRLLRNEGTI